MKTIGGILLVFGILSFIGAASKGNSVFGPCFWGALGAFLLYRANKREDEESENTTTIPQAEEKSVSEELVSLAEPLEAVPETEREAETLEEIQSRLTTAQREAAVCLIAFFGGYNDSPITDSMTYLLHQSAIFFGISDAPAAMGQMMSKYSDAEAVIDIVKTIKERKAKEFILLTCYDLTSISGTSWSYEMLENIAAEMGYDKEKLKQLTNNYTF